LDSLALYHWSATIRFIGSGSGLRGQLGFPSTGGGHDNRPASEITDVANQERAAVIDGGGKGRDERTDGAHVPCGGEAAGRDASATQLAYATGSVAVVGMESPEGPLTTQSGSSVS